MARQTTKLHLLPQIKPSFKLTSLCVEPVLAPVNAVMVFLDKTWPNTVKYLQSIDNTFLFGQPWRSQLQWKLSIYEMLKHIHISILAVIYTHWGEAEKLTDRVTEWWLILSRTTSSRCTVKTETHQLCRAKFWDTQLDFFSSIIYISDKKDTNTLTNHDEPSSIHSYHVDVVNQIRNINCVRALIKIIAWKYFHPLHTGG